jgi:hypothetical protein
MRLFFLTIPKPLKQNSFLKKIIHSALPSGLEALRAGSGGAGSASRMPILKDFRKKTPRGLS